MDPDAGNGAAEDAGGPAEEGQIPPQCDPAFGGSRLGRIVFSNSTSACSAAWCTAGFPAPSITDPPGISAGGRDVRRVVRQTKHLGPGCGQPAWSRACGPGWRAPAVIASHARRPSLCGCPRVRLLMGTSVGGHARSGRFAAPQCTW